MTYQRGNTRVAGPAQEEAAARFLRALAGRIRLLRLTQNLTQQDLSAACGISRSFISLIETGARGADIRNVYRIALALDVPMTQLVDVGKPIPTYGLPTQSADVGTERWRQTGDLIRQLRRQQKWNQHELAAAADVSHYALRAQERGQRGLAEEELGRIAVVLDVPLPELLDPLALLEEMAGVRPMKDHG